jgi:hypothetical protein
MMKTPFYGRRVKRKGGALPFRNANTAKPPVIVPGAAAPYFK